MRTGQSDQLGRLISEVVPKNLVKKESSVLPAVTVTKNVLGVITASGAKAGLVVAAQESVVALATAAMASDAKEDLTLAVVLVASRSEATVISQLVKSSMRRVLLAHMVSGVTVQLNLLASVQNALSALYVPTLVRAGMLQRPIVLIK